MMPDELIDILENQTKSRISRENIFKFQKLYYSLLAVCSIRKCFYIQHFLITRHKDEYITVDEIFNLEGVQEKSCMRFISPKKVLKEIGRILD